MQHFVISCRYGDARGGGHGDAGTRCSGRSCRARRKRAVDDDQVAWASRIHRRLDGSVAGIFPVHISGSFAANGNRDRVDRRLAGGGRDRQFPAQRAGVAHLLPGASGDSPGYVGYDSGVAPTHDAHVFASDSDGALGGPKAVVASDELLVVREDACGRAGIRVVRHNLVAEGGNGNFMANCAYPRSRAIAVHSQDCRSAVRVVAIRRIVAFGKSRRGNHRSVQVVGIGGHERVLVAEVAVIRVVVRIGDQAAWRWARNRTRIVHASNHHPRRIAGGVGWIDLPGRVHQSIEDAPLVRVHAGNLHPVVIFNGYGGIWHGKLLAVGRSRWVEFGGEVIGNEPGEVRSGRRLGPNEEVRLRLHLVRERDLLTVAQMARCAGKWRHFPGFWRHAHVIGDDAELADTRRRHLDESARPKAAHVERPTHVRRWIRASAAGSVTRVSVVDGSLVGHDENIRDGAELLCHGSNEVVANEDVLVFLFDDFIVRRGYSFNHVYSGWQNSGCGAGVDGSTQGRICYQGTGSSGPRRDREAAGGMAQAIGAGELVQAIIRCRLYLIEVVIAVVTFVLRIVRQCSGGEQVIGSSRKRVAVERIGGILSGAVHVGQARGRIEALCPIVPTAGCGGINQRQSLCAVGACAFLIEIDGDAGNERLPEVLKELPRVVKRSSRAVNHMAPNPACLSRHIG